MPDQGAISTSARGSARCARSSAGSERTSARSQGEVPTHRAGPRTGGPRGDRHGPGEDPSQTMTFAAGDRGPDPPPRPLPPAPARASVTSSPPSASPKASAATQVRRELGQGGFGKVYVGYDTGSTARSRSRSRSGTSPRRRSSMFLQEAKRLARLKHPGIVTVYDVGVQDGRCFIVSDFVAGTSLRDWLRDRKPTPEQSAEIVAAVADALDHAHAPGDDPPRRQAVEHHARRASGRSCSTSGWP